MIANPDLAILFLRLGIAFLYIYAAYMNSKDKVSLEWTIENTKPLFRNTKIDGNSTAIKFFAYFGILIMYVGGVSVLLGIEPRVGAFLLLIFTVGGTVIHWQQKNDAREVAIRNSNNIEFASIAWSAYAAHFANILKNICLILVLFFICMNGAGKYQITDLFSNAANK